jgi:hypothetical protein
MVVKEKQTVGYRLNLFQVVKLGEMNPLLIDYWESIKYHMMLDSPQLSSYFEVVRLTFHYKVRNFGVCMVEVYYYVIRSSYFFNSNY